MGVLRSFSKKKPDSCDMKTLYGSIKMIEKVRDVFVLNRKDKKGKIFYFVRFGSDMNKVKMESEL